MLVVPRQEIRHLYPHHLDVRFPGYPVHHRILRLQLRTHPPAYPLQRRPPNRHLRKLAPERLRVPIRVPGPQVVRKPSPGHPLNHALVPAHPISCRLTSPHISLATTASISTVTPPLCTSSSLADTHFP